MIGIIGVITIFVMVFGGYLLAGGKMGIILKSLPFEMIMICGAALGAFMISNDGSAIKHTIKDMGKVFKGPKWKHEDYRDLLCLLFELIRLARQNPVAIEEHIEAPDASSIFSKYPRILKDKEAIAVTSREVVRVFLKQLWFQFVPVFHGLQGRSTMKN
jgi:chemotaxis protein MotA